ncbi:YeeE/YedE family protein [Rhodobacterales bacterium 52_120_T64]|nr:YeeE/YedE family protein [Rhodobacterales bacterium 52_120_T64]
MEDNHWAALAGLFAGGALGLSSSIGRFCTLGAIEDALYGNDYSRLRMWALALAVAISGMFTLEEFGYVDYSQTIYYAIKWNPLASIVGGLMFGWGMALAGNCGFGALSRMAGGDMRSFVVAIVMAISAYMAIGGPTAVVREWLFPQQAFSGEMQGLAHLTGRWFDAGPLIPALMFASICAVWAFSGKQFRTSPTHIIWSVVVGMAVVLGFWATSLIANNGFDEISVESVSYSAPMGETLIYLMTWSGSTMNFGIGSVTGVLIGSIIGTKVKDRFRWEACDDARELGRSVFGAFIMGTGGVVALGCSIGQGLTGFSVLAYSAPVVLASIFIGASLGLRYLIHGFQNV